MVKKSISKNFVLEMQAFTVETN